MTNPYHLVEPGGKLMILGRPTLKWDGAPAPEEYFRSFGFSEVHTLDVSGRDGASHFFDLNSSDTPADLIGRYRAVNSGGTLEHIYNLPNAIRTALLLLEDDGIFLFNTPVNNRIDHGFYQISPTLKFDLCGTNALECEFSLATLTAPSDKVVQSIPLYPGEARAFAASRRMVGHSLAIRKTAQSTIEKVPMQSVYRKMSGLPPFRWRFRACEPQEYIAGDRRSLLTDRFQLTSDKTRFVDGRYMFPFRDERYPPSLPGRPFRSTAVVFEDGELLDYIVSEPESVAARNGSFCHFGAFVHLTAKDGSDPRDNSRTYEVAFTPRIDVLLASL